MLTAKKIWNNSPVSKRKQLLQAMGYRKNSGFAKVKFEDLPKRSGGMVKRDIERLVEIRDKRRKQ